MFDTDGNQRVDKAEFLVVSLFMIRRNSIDKFSANSVHKFIGRLAEITTSSNNLERVFKEIFYSHRLDNCWVAR